MHVVKPDFSSCITLLLTNHKQSVRSCVNILYTIHLPGCPSPSVYLTCVLRWSITFTEPAAKAFLRYLSQVCHSYFLNFPFLISIFSFSVCLPLSRSLFLSCAFYFSCFPQSQTSWLWTAFFLPLWGLTSHSCPWVFLPEGSWATEVWRVGSQMDADMLGMRVCDRAWLRGVVDQPQLSLTNTEGVRCVLCCYYS